MYSGSSRVADEETRQMHPLLSECNIYNLSFSKEHRMHNRTLWPLFNTAK